MMQQPVVATKSIPSVLVPVDYSAASPPMQPQISTETLVEMLKKKVEHHRFPVALWILASEPLFEPIKWSSSGRSIIIDQATMEPMLKHFFRSDKFASFIRQLHLYGFRKVSRGGRNHHKVKAAKGSQVDDVLEYLNSQFQHDRYDLATRMHRSYNTTKSHTAPFAPSPILPLTPPPTPPEFSAISSPQQAVIPSLENTIPLDHSYSNDSINSVGISSQSSSSIDQSSSQPLILFAEIVTSYHAR